MNKQITQVVEKNPKQNQAVQKRHLSDDGQVSNHPFFWNSTWSVCSSYGAACLTLHLLPRCLLYNHTVHRVLSGQRFSYPPPPPCTPPPSPARQQPLLCLLMTYSPLFGQKCSSALWFTVLFILSFL